MTTPCWLLAMADADWAAEEWYIRHMPTITGHRGISSQGSVMGVSRQEADCQMPIPEEDSARHCVDTAVVVSEGGKAEPIDPGPSNALIREK